MNSNNIICHIIGLNPTDKKNILQNEHLKKFNIIDLDILNQEIFDNIDMKKLYKSYHHFKNSKNEKYKDIEKKMTNFWEDNLINLIENNILLKKKNIVIGNNSHFRNLSKKVNISTNNRFIVETSKDDIKKIINYNIDKYRKNIINGTYPLNNIDFEYLLKIKQKLEENYKGNGYLLKTSEQIIKILELLINRDNSLDGLWISSSEPYNVATKMYPKKNNKIIAYSNPIYALINSFNLDEKEIEKSYKGDKIKLIEKKENGLDCFKKKKFLYYVDIDTFIPHDKGNNSKYFSQVPIMIVDKEKIPNVYKKLKEIHMI